MGTDFMTTDLGIRGITSCVFESQNSIYYETLDFCKGFHRLLIIKTIFATSGFSYSCYRVFSVSSPHLQTDVELKTLTHCQCVEMAVGSEGGLV